MSFAAGIDDLIIGFYSMVQAKLDGVARKKLSPIYKESSSAAMNSLRPLIEYRKRDKYLRILYTYVYYTYP